MVKIIKGMVMKSPGKELHPDYKITIERMNEKVEVFIDNEKIAETRSAIKLLEQGYAPVIYIPKNDIKAIDLIKNKDYQCPFKGTAEIYNIKHGSHNYENAAWCYEEPYDEVLEIQGRVAFYPDKVQEIRIS